MRRGMLTGIACVGALSVRLLAGQSATNSLDDVLARVAESVARYYSRAQSVICLETIRMQSLGADLLNDDSAPRRLDYELRVAWEPARDGDTPDASVLRHLVKVNGRAPRLKDEPGCMDPKAVSPEPLSMFLSKAQSEYIFKMAGTAKVDGRAALMVDYKGRQPGPITATWNKDCFSIELPGRSRGRVWMDAETGDVLRLDEHLTGMFDYTLPADHRRAGGPLSVTIERLDSSIRYRAVTFQDPDEVLMLPASINTVTVVRNAGVPRLRTQQVFSKYQRFITGGRVVQ
jgi:hypothetical protein